MIRSTRIGLSSLACLSLTSLVGARQGGEPPPPPDAPGSVGGGPEAPERKLLKRFDADANGRLEGEEIDQARDTLRKEAAANPQPPRGRGRPGGPGGPGRPGGPGGPGGPEGGREMPKFSAGRDVDPMTVTSHWDKPLYQTDVVRTVVLDIPYDDWIGDLELFWNSDVELPVQFMLDEEKFESVGLGYRGASSYMMVPRLGKRSFNISIDFAEPGLDVKGYRTLNLLNAHGDPSLMSTVLFSHLASRHIPAPKANFVEVVINGECWGVFTSVEQFNKDFVTSRWPQFKGEGARWKVSGSPRGSAGLDFEGEDLDAYKELYDLKGGGSKADWEALRELCRTLSQTPIAELEAKIRPMLDVDGVLWFLALDIGLVNSDGYWTRASDYSLYRDPNGAFHVIPHDMNEAFKMRAGGPPGMMRRGPEGDDGPPPPEGVGGPRGRGFAGPAVELDPFHGMDDPGKPLRSRLLQVPAFRKQYIANLKTLADELAWENLGPVVARNRELIGELVKLDTRKLVTTEAFERATSPEPPASPDEPSLRNFCERRSRFLREWNPDAPAKPATPSTPGPAPTP